MTYREAIEVRLLDLFYTEDIDYYVFHLSITETVDGEGRPARFVDLAGKTKCSVVDTFTIKAWKNLSGEWVGEDKEGLYVNKHDAYTMRIASVKQEMEDEKMTYHYRIKALEGKLAELEEM